MVSLVKEIEPELVGPDDAAKIVGGEWILRTMKNHKWIQPRIQRNKMTKYLVIELRQAARRLAFEQLPKDLKPAPESDTAPSSSDQS